MTSISNIDKKKKGKSRKYALQIVDTTEKILLEKQLQIVIEELRIKNTDLENFTYIVSHDLREPLRSVDSFVKLLDKHYADKLDERGGQFMDFIKRATSRMDEMIVGLNHFSRLGKSEEKKVEVNPNQIIEEITEDLHLLRKQKQVNFHVEELPTVRVYPVEFKTLLRNLLSNAIKFSHKDKQNNIYISTEKSDNKIIFHIRDEGIGIDPKNHEKIFLIFKRLHAQQEYDGSGLGLAFCKKIVDLHDGIKDLEAKRLRTVGDPVRRFSEDALRMMRAVRFSAQLGFTIDTDTMTAISKHSDLITCSGHGHQ